jgi:hypothetical protein
LINEILIELKKKTPEIYFDKVSQILESENRLDELNILAGKQQNKFSLINKIAIKKLPDHDALLLTNYVKHFLMAVSEARETFHQKQIFEKALTYLDRLPKEVSEKILSQILDKISKSNFVYRLLKKHLEVLEENSK